MQNGISSYRIYVVIHYSAASIKPLRHITGSLFCFKEDIAKVQVYASSDELIYMRHKKLTEDQKKKPQKRKSLRQLIIKALHVQNRERILKL